MAKKPTTKWIAGFYRTEGGKVPARDWLDSIPDSARRHLLAVIVAVRDAPPPSFPASLYWHAMHGDMKGFYEARDRHGAQLYRLLCVLDRDAIKRGLPGPAIVLLLGGQKKDDTEMAKSVYDAARNSRDRYQEEGTSRILLV